jgi:predicted DNA-binding protein (MmcQ/YjbR family)
MEFEEVSTYCLSLEGSSEETPFGPEALVYKTKNKMFALLMFRDNTLSINLKNDPEVNIDLREKHTFIQPGYHMNKKHWNTVTIHANIDKNFLKTLILQSYEAVLAKKK